MCGRATTPRIGGREPKNRATISGRAPKNRATTSRIGRQQPKNRATSPRTGGGVFSRTHAGVLRRPVGSVRICGARLARGACFQAPHFRSHYGSALPGLEPLGARAHTHRPPRSRQLPSPKACARALSQMAPGAHTAVEAGSPGAPPTARVTSGHGRLEGAPPALDASDGWQAGGRARTALVRAVRARLSSARRGRARACARTARARAPRTRERRLGALCAGGQAGRAGCESARARGRGAGRSRCMIPVIMIGRALSNWEPAHDREYSSMSGRPALWKLCWRSIVGGRINWVGVSGSFWPNLGNH